MPRTIEDTLADVEKLDVELYRLENYPFGKDHFERQFQSLLAGVVEDLGDAGTVLQTLLTDNRKLLINALRDRAQFIKSGKQALFNELTSDLNGIGSLETTECDRSPNRTKV